MAKQAKAAGGGAGSGEELIAALRKKTGQDRENRPGWSFELAGDLLGEHLRPDEPDFWTPEQREKGVTLDFVSLTLTDHERAEGRAAARFAAHGGSEFTSPSILLEERGYVALWRVDGKVVPDDDGERRRVWEALGPEGRGMIVGQYMVMASGSVKAREEAAKRAAATFRVRA